MSQDASLLLGTFGLMGFPDEDLPYDVDIKSVDADFGNADPIEVTIQTLLRQSSYVVTEGYGNREVRFKVEISANDGKDLPAATAALWAEVGKPNTLVWTSPIDFAPPTVLRVVTSSMKRVTDGVDEAVLFRRVYELRLVCTAFNYSVDEVVTDAYTPNTTVVIDTIVDACTTTTGWSTAGTGQSVIPTNPATAVQSSPDTFLPELTKTATVSMTGTPIYVADINFIGFEATPVVSFNGETTMRRPIAQGPATEVGYVRCYYACPVTTITKVRFWSTEKDFGLTPGRIAVSEIRKQNQSPGFGSGKQKTFTVDISGSAPTDVALEVYNTTAALGKVTLYTYPSVGGQKFVPALGPLLVTAGSTRDPDSTSLSGSSNVLTNVINTYDIPGDQMPPATYEMGAWLNSSTTGTGFITFSFQTYVGATGIPGDLAQYAVPITVVSADLNVWKYYKLGRYYLPARRRVPGTTMKTRVRIGALGPVIRLDDVNLFDITHGALTMVDCGSGTLDTVNGASRLWVTPATLNWPSRSIMRGTLANQTDAISTGDTVTAWGDHQLPPQLNNIFAITTGTPNTSIRARFTPAWFDDAGM